MSWLFRAVLLKWNSSDLLSVSQTHSMILRPRRWFNVYQLHLSYLPCRQRSWGQCLSSSFLHRPPSRLFPLSLPAALPPLRRCCQANPSSEASTRAWSCRRSRGPGSLWAAYWTPAEEAQCRLHHRWSPAGPLHRWSFVSSGESSSWAFCWTSRCPLVFQGTGLWTGGKSALRQVAICSKKSRNVTWSSRSALWEM